jgi:hypothetical protein
MFTMQNFNKLPNYLKKLKKYKKKINNKIF